MMTEAVVDSDRIRHDESPPSRSFEQDLRERFETLSSRSMSLTALMFIAVLGRTIPRSRISAAGSSSLSKTVADQIDLLEEVGLLDPFQRRHAIGFPGHLGVTHLCRLWRPDRDAERRFRPSPWSRDSSRPCRPTA